MAVDNSFVSLQYFVNILPTVSDSTLYNSGNSTSHT